VSTDALAPVSAFGARLQVGWITGGVWLFGSLVVAAAQPGHDRKAAAAVAAVCGAGAILAVRYLTADPARSYLRSLLAGIVVVPVAAVWMLRALLLSGRTDFGTSFLVDGWGKRITLPLLFVLLAPLVAQVLPKPAALWQERKMLWHEARPLDWIMLAYLAVAVPAFLYGIPHRASLSFFAQDVGLVVFFAFMYLAGRVASGAAALAWAEELVDVLLLLALTHFVLLGWDTSPLYNYIEAACAGAIVFALFRPSRRRLLPAAIAVMILVADAVATANGTDSTITISLLGAVGIVLYLIVRSRELIPQWLIVAVAVVALVVFVGFTSDGRTLRGQYHGPNISNAARTYEAGLVRHAVRSSPVTLLIGRGFGSTLDMRTAPPSFATTLQNGGRDLTHVPEVHLLGYSFLFKEGLLGVLWLIVFAVGLSVLGIRALERSARTRDPSLAVYAAVALLGLVASLAAASHLPANPLNGLSIGLLVTCFGVVPAKGRVEDPAPLRPRE
jgi:hypothetical protein